MILKWLKKSLKDIFKGKKRRRSRRKKKALRRRIKKTRVIRKKTVTRKVKRPSSKKVRVVSQPAKKIKEPAVRIIKPPPALVRTFPRTQSIQKRTPARGMLIGRVTHYFNKIQVAVIQVEVNFKTGESIEVMRGTLSIGKEAVKSMQINHIPIDEAKRGEEIGLKLTTRAEAGDEIYRL